MIAVVCVDDKGGMLFNRRRQSRDRVLRAELLQWAGGRPIWMNEYSAGQFSQEERAHISVAEDFLERAGKGELSFVEDQPLAPWEEDLEEVVLYRWNRVYPSDHKLDLSLTEPAWRCVEQSEFTGSSHEKITKEIYQK